jgi:Holliday junction resolvase RusA-like endonuclease
MISFSVKGLPVPQGSMTIARAGRKTWMRPANAAKLKPWRRLVAESADLGVTFDCPVKVVMRFEMPRPKKPKFGRPAVKPDCDKLARAVMDGMTDGGLLADDSRVVDLHVTEFYAERPGVDVTVMEVE